MQLVKNHSSAQWPHYFRTYFEVRSQVFSGRSRAALTFCPRWVLFVLTLAACPSPWNVLSQLWPRSTSCWLSLVCCLRFIVMCLATHTLSLIDCHHEIFQQRSGLGECFLLPNLVQWSRCCCDPSDAQLLLRVYWFDNWRWWDLSAEAAFVDCILYIVSLQCVYRNICCYVCCVKRLL